MFGHFSFLINMCFFTIIPIIIIWGMHFNFLRTKLKLIGKFVLVALLFQVVADLFAIYWKAWLFVGDKNLGITIINFPIEDIIFVVLIMIVISSVVLVLTSPKSDQKTYQKINQK